MERRVEYNSNPVVYQADGNGEIYNFSNESIDGSFKDEKMTARVSYTIQKSLRRLNVLGNHMTVLTRACTSLANQGHGPCIAVTPSVGMVDEKVNIDIRGLNAKQIVTVVADVEENGIQFESRCVYQADGNGEINNFSNESVDGSFKGIEPMGLFWSLHCVSAPKKYARLVKKDVSTPMNFSIKVYPDNQNKATLIHQPLTETRVQRFYQKPGVRRIPLTGRFKGAIFVPEGEGPFPGVIDLYGGLVSLIETRAALLASHGYATLALSYLHGEGLPDMLYDADFNYVKEAYEWFMKEDYIDKNRLGIVGLCFGGFLSLALASVLPQVRAVVNINGFSFIPEVNKINCDWEKWLDKNDVLCTEEGLVISDVYMLKNSWPVPAWQHGAKILVIVAEDDKQVHPKCHTLYYESCPPQFKENIRIFRYPGAGHMIEPPYSPHYRAVTPGRKRLRTINFIPEKFHDEDMMTGGWPDTHAHAQEDSWMKILNFLEENVKNVS
ncbi:bile acid-CoA:amino acid N-acyltransferase-like isoform X2 [Mercenaria mercenaria]|uniref:bile acid-CoA:amino acid N-acyltransferase-like isoform X2 n=1 Tax=Mercenaria mercenaria TaxID=6596 RepID=UPI00234ED8DB|nr:bile acid-CoA:amino acid N-acyltransferase-like isoform X2 [Mercenaria mercenaria]